jgi:hypothetical protein
MQSAATLATSTRNGCGSQSSHPQRSCLETPMSRTELPEPEWSNANDDEDFDAWSLDEMDDFADTRSLRASGAHDSDD